MNTTNPSSITETRLAQLRYLSHGSDCRL